MFVDEYRQLGIPGAEEVAGRCVLFEDLIAGIVEYEPGALAFREGEVQVAIHDHCHAKALRPADQVAMVVERIPGSSVGLLESGCCGMAGAFGMLEKKDVLSRKVAEPLVEMLEIRHLTDVEPLHVAELLAEFLEPDA
jgi:Fe-S oxidoreductase